MATSSSSCSSSGDSDSFDIVADESEDAKYTVTLKLPKFCNNCTGDDFIAALIGVIDSKEIRGLGKLKRSNEWQVTLTSIEARDKLLVKGHMTVSKKKCIILPCGSKQVVGRIHWLPVEARDEVIKKILQNFGEVTQLFKEKLSTEPDSPDSLIRFFLLSLNESSSATDIPHFISINKHQGLIIVKGRDPMCLECREVGHRKAKCPNKKQVTEKSTSKRKKVANRAKTNPPPQDDNLSATGAGSAKEPNASQKKKIPKSNDVTAVASGSASNVGGIEAAADVTNENKSHKVADDVKCLQDLMKEFSQKMNDVLTGVAMGMNVATEVIAAEVSASSTNQNISVTKKPRKKRKKAKTNNNYDPTAAEAISNDNSSSGQYSPKGSLDSGIALNTLSVSTNTAVNMGEIESCLTKVSLGVNSSEASSLNAGHTTTCVNTKKKKKNKKKTGSAAIPGLTLQ